MQTHRDKLPTQGSNCSYSGISNMAAQLLRTMPGAWNRYPPTLIPGYISYLSELCMRAGRDTGVFRLVYFTEQLCSKWKVAGPEFKVGTGTIGDVQSASP